MMQNVEIKLDGSPHSYRISIGHNLLAACGGWAKNCLSKKTQKIVIVSNKKVFGFYGGAVKKSLEDCGFDVTVRLIGDGERYKNFRVLENTLKFFSEQKLKRTDAVVALGGGVVGDLAGFAAAIYLRGIAFLQIPTTLLAMIDSSVGGKTAVNSGFGKNLIGAFYQPHGVLIDVETLKTLAKRELTAGFCEVVKQAAIADKELFAQTAGFLHEFPVNKFKKHFLNIIFFDSLQKLIAAQVAFKAKIVSQDEKENVARTDGRSRKILNFGHTVAHALEKVTNYKRFKHGEAVGYGILVAAEISKLVANFVQDELKSLNDVVRLTGELPTADDLDVEKIFDAIAFDKKNVGHTLQWILLEKIGEPKIFSGKNIPESIIKKSLRKILQFKSK